MQNSVKQILCIAILLVQGCGQGCSDPDQHLADGGPWDGSALDKDFLSELELSVDVQQTDIKQADLKPSGPLDRTGTIWRPYLEWSLKNPSHGAAPFDLVAKVTFIHTASAEKQTTEMFYDGAGVWKFRFTGTRLGQWTFKTTSADPDLDGKSGKVVITKNADPGAHGFLKKLGNKWGWQGTERAFVPQLVMYEHPAAYHNKPTKIDADIKQFFQTHGFNGLHTMVFCRWFDINQTTYDKISANPGPDRRTFEALELLIAKAHAKGGMVHIWAWGDEQRKQTPKKWGLNKAVDQRLQRYIAARLGPLPGWSIGYGFDLDEWVKQGDLKKWHAYMHQHLAHSHFLGGRSGGPNSGTNHQKEQIYEGLDYSGYEHHRPTYQVYAAALDARPNKPTMSEDRFRIRKKHVKDYDMDLTRRGLWHSAMAGGVANIWGNVINGGTAAAGSEPYPQAYQIKTYASFMSKYFWADMSRANSLTNGYGLQRQGKQHLVFYREDASSMSLDLSGTKGTQPAVAVDTKKVYKEISLGKLVAKKQTFKAPYKSDWAIAVGKF